MDRITNMEGKYIVEEKSPTNFFVTVSEFETDDLSEVNRFLMSNRSIDFNYQIDDSAVKECGDKECLVNERFLNTKESILIRIKNLITEWLKNIYS